MNDLLFRKPKPSPFLLGGAILFGLLAAASFVEAVRDSPMVLAGYEVDSSVERLGYRIGAGLICTLLAAALYPRSEPSS